MYCSKSSLFAVIGLALTLTFAIFGLSYAQRSDDGTGAGSGNSPPIDEPRGGAAMPDAASPMDAPPMPPDENAGQAAPEENNTAAPEENKKYDGPPDPD
jgi:hypothetical protein